MTRFLLHILLFSILAFVPSCLKDLSALSSGDDSFSAIEKVQLPYLRNSANECYFLDEFMPVPDSMVAGKHGRLDLRYYTYKTASYKDWQQKHVVLAFYSQDDHCWSLFEEAYVNDD